MKNHRKKKRNKYKYFITTVMIVVKGWGLFIPSKKIKHFHVLRKAITKKYIDQLFY